VSPLEGIPESENARPDEEDFAYSYGTEFESRDLRFGSVISRSVSMTKKDAQKKDFKGDQNYYETEDLDYTIDFDDDSKAGEFMKSQEGARSEKLHTREDSGEMDHKSVSIKFLPKTKGTMSMLNFRNISLDFKNVKTSDSKKDPNTSSIEINKNKNRYATSFDQNKPAKPFLTWGKQNMLERMKELVKERKKEKTGLSRREDTGTSSDKSQVSVSDFRKKKQTFENKKDKKIEEESNSKPKIKTEHKNSETKLRTKIKRNLAKKFLDIKKFSFDKNRSHSAYKLNISMASSTKLKNVDFKKTNTLENKLVHNRSMSESSKGNPKPEPEPKTKHKSPGVNKLVHSTSKVFKIDVGSKEKPRKKTRSPQQIMRGILNWQRTANKPNDSNSVKKKLKLRVNSKVEG
jgi:hypothetical protein